MERWRQEKPNDFGRIAANWIRHKRPDAQTLADCVGGKRVGSHMRANAELTGTSRLYAQCPATKESEVALCVRAHFSHESPYCCLNAAACAGGSFERRAQAVKLPIIFLLSSSMYIQSAICFSPKLMRSPFL